MNTAILQKELVLLLRQKRVFVMAGILYGILVLAISFRWIGVSERLDRDVLSRSLFYFLIALCYFGFFTFHALHASVRIMTQEVEKGTATLLRVSPLSPWSIVFQKLLTPFAIEWLIFLGTLPFLSLVFILGGVPPREFFYQIVNLTVWLNTVILIGLFVGTQGNESSKNIRTAWFLILLVAFLAPALGSFLQAVISWDEIGSNETVLTVCNFIAIHLLMISPFSMVSSYVPPDPSSGEAFWPALTAWFFHSILQVLLFLGAVRNWKRISDEVSVAVNYSDASGVYGVLRWLKRGRRGHELFPEGWRIFHELEERETYKRWRPSRAIWMMSVLLLVPTMVLGGSVTIFGGTVLIGLVVLVMTVGFSSNSLKKEIRRKTSVFLVTAPVDPSDIIFGKWSFYMRQGFNAWSVGLLALLAAHGIVWGVGEEISYGYFTIFGWVNWTWFYATYLVIFCFLPFLSINRLADSMRLYPPLAPYLVLIGLFCCAPIGLMMAAAMVGAGLVDVSAHALRFTPKARIPVVLLGWVCFLGCILNIFLFPLAQFGSFSRVLYPTVLAFDLCILPLSAGLFLWILFCEKRLPWWRKHFMH